MKQRWLFRKIPFQVHAKANSTSIHKHIVRFGHSLIGAPTPKI
jgi:hypothetical protein